MPKQGEGLEKMKKFSQKWELDNGHLWIGFHLKKWNNPVASDL